eukprot:5091576-Prymnesium_polylepis.1
MLSPEAVSGDFCASETGERHGTLNGHDFGSCGCRVGGGEWRQQCGGAASRPVQPVSGWACVSVGRGRVQTTKEVYSLGWRTSEGEREEAGKETDCRCIR